MSASSGREGFCARCGHANNEHASKRDSKCKKCKKVFEICQAGVHGGKSGRGWRLCFVPCRCGDEYHPDKAKIAVPLEPHQYVQDHPAYRPLYPDEDETDTTIDDIQTGVKRADQASSPTPQGPAYKQHTRTDSGSSEDPLAWSAERYKKETTTGIDALVDTLNETHIEENNATDWSEWAWDAGRNQSGRYRMSNGKYQYEWREPEPSTLNSRDNTTDWSEWAWNADRSQWGRYRMSLGQYDYEWRNEDSGEGKGKGKGTGPSKGKGTGNAAK